MGNPGNMDRRNFLKTVSLAGMASLTSRCSMGAAKKHPNILFMFADDQAQSCLGYAGNPIIQTPNMDRLAAEGVYFENAFVTTAICCSSRASILTGQYTRRHAITDFQKPLSAKAFAQSYPAILRKAGYRTGYLGKFAVGWPNDDIKHLSLPADKFDYWYGFGQMLNFEQKIDGESRYLTDVMTEKALDFLRTNPADQPFCLTISFKEPHGPYNYFDPDFPDPESIRIVNYESRTSVDVMVTGKKWYYWAVDAYVGSPADPVLSPIFSFWVGNQPPTVDISADPPAPWLTGGTVDVNLDGTVTDDFTAEPTPKWSVVSEPNEGTAIIDDVNAVDTFVTFTKIGEYTLRLTADDGELVDNVGSAKITIEVFENSCEAAKSLPGFVPIPGDLNADCRKNFFDFELFAAGWLDCNALDCGE